MNKISKILKTIRFWLEYGSRPDPLYLSGHTCKAIVNEVGASKRRA